MKQERILPELQKIREVLSLMQTEQRPTDNNVIKEVLDRLSNVEVKMAHFWNLCITHNKRKEARLNSTGKNFSDALAGQPIFD